MTETATGPGFALPRGVEPGRAVVVGAGPNGLTAAALLAREGWEVDVFERAPVPGGACASAPVPCAEWSIAPPVAVAAWAVWSAVAVVSAAAWPPCSWPPATGIPLACASR